MRGDEFRRSIRRTLFSVSIVPLSLMGLLAIVLIWQFNNLVSSNLSVAQTDRVIAKSYQVQKLLLDMETGLRGYIATGDALFLEPYNQSLFAVEPAISELKKLISENAEQTNRANNIGITYLNWKLYADKLIATRKRDSRNAVLPEIEGKQMMDEMRSKISAIIQTEQQLHAERTLATQRTTSIAAVTGIGLTVFLGVVFALYFRRQLFNIASIYKEALNTVKKQSEELRENEERYRSLVEVSPSAILILKNGKITYSNPAGLKLYGVEKPEELLGKTPLEIIHPDYHDIVKERIDTLLEKDVPLPAIEQKMIRSDKSVIEVETAATSFSDKGEKAVLGIWNDITHRKAIENSLRESEERFRLLVEGVKDYGLFMLDKDGYVISWNSGAENIKGFKAEEVSGKHFSDFFSEEDVEGCSPQKIMDAAAVNGVYEEECWLLRKGGTHFRANVTLTALRDKNDNLRGFANVTRDVTERRLLEEQLQQSQKMEAIGRLAGSIAHDFNNLLTAIIGNVQLAMYRAPKDDAIRPNLEEIDAASEKATSLTRQLLTFSRKQAVQPVIVDMNDIVKGVQNILRRLIGEDIQLIVQYEPASANVRADPGQIEQIIMNLAVNARDAMPAGGKLIIEVHQVYLDNDYARTHIDVSPGHYVMLVVSDNGSGMDKEIQSHIFEPFFTTKEFGKGTGLGLATVYGIVKQSRGDVWVYSEVGRGTTFKIYLPLITESAEFNISSVIEEIVIPSGTETVLLVEDDEGLRPLLGEVLKEKGYKVLTASDGKDAIGISEKFDGTIHLLVTDIVMPEMRGNTLAQELEKTRPQLKVLFMSGYTDETIVHHGVLDSSDNYLQKPFAPWTLVRKVRDVLDK